ncbi:unnamed protein product, partial [Trichogramma brassicae]
MAHNDLNSNLLLLRSGLSNPLFPVLQDFFLQLARLELFDMHTCMRRNRSHISPRATIILRSSFTTAVKVIDMVLSSLTANVLKPEREYEAAVSEGTRVRSFAYRESHDNANGNDVIAEPDKRVGPDNPFKKMYDAGGLKAIRRLLACARRLQRYRGKSRELPIVLVEIHHHRSTQSMGACRTLCVVIALSFSNARERKRDCIQMRYKREKTIDQNKRAQRRRRASRSILPSRQLYSAKSLVILLTEHFLCFALAMFVAPVHVHRYVYSHTQGTSTPPMIANEIQEMTSLTLTRTRIFVYITESSTTTLMLLYSITMPQGLRERSSKLQDYPTRSLVFASA